MKKLLILTFIIGITLPGIANSKTEGSYFGVDILLTEVEYEGVDRFSPGLGFNYKYAFNFSDFYIAPTIYFNNNEAKASKNINSKTIDLSYGGRFDFGYDLTERFSLFAALGFQQNHETYRINENDTTHKNLYLTYGFGARYAIEDDVDLVVSAYDLMDNKTFSTDFDNKLFSAGLAFNF